LPLRFYRLVRIGRCLSLNVSKAGLSISVGPPGVRLTFGKRGVRETVGIPGTGLYYTRFRRAPRLRRPT